ncbi:hypothetical protein KC351_g16625 [Hortaea werneckii]|nr:hypothetical protein KC351_g16625 [Hortaea werneckii]
MAPSRADAESQVRSQGFSHVFTWSDGPNSHYPSHSHSGVTTHLVLKGSLTAVYPDDPESEKKTYSVGETWEVPAKKKHEVWVGPEGCTYVIGE